MSERLTFDAKIEKLAAYFEQLKALDPEKMDQRDRPPFYSSSFNVSRALYEARTHLLFDAGCHARIEYGNRGFTAKDLRTDTPEERQERAGVLAMVTVPSNPDVFYDRAAQIGEMLTHVTDGDTLSIASHKYGGFEIRDPQLTGIDDSRELYLIFDNDHISTRDVGLYYDRPGDWAGGEYQETERAFNLLLPAMFDGVVTYPVRAA